MTPRVPRWPWTGTRGSLAALAPDLARGVRAAVVTLVPFYLAAVLRRPELTWTALGGWLGTLADPGGSRASRARTLVVFAVAGALLVAPAEALAPSPWLATLALGLTAFAMSLMRAFGGAAAGVGTFLTIIVAVASARARTEPIRDALFFALGGGMALLVSSIVWPVWTHLPVRRAVASVYGALAQYVEAVERATADRWPSRDPAWTALMREHHKRIRAAIEAARDVALSARARRQGETRLGGDVRALLGAAEAEFPLLVALVVELESLDPDARVLAARRLASAALSSREVERVLVARAIYARAPGVRPALEGAPAALEVGEVGAIGAPLIASLADRIARANDLALDLVRGLGSAAIGGTPRISLAPPALDARRAGTDLPGRLRAALRTLRDALSPRSPFFQHALRTACAATVASLVGALLSPRRAYWVTLTTLAILQPYPGATMKRAGERVVGTILGSIVAAFVMMVVGSPVLLSALMVPLSVAAVATRPRSYRLFTFFLTPVFVLLAERYTGDWWAAASRAGDTLLGGATALLAGVILVPSSERGRLPDALDAMLAAVADYAGVALASVAARRAPGVDERVAACRRASGIALGEAETSLERFLAEPLHERAYAADAMMLVTYARRLATALTSVDTLATHWPDRPSSTDAKAAKLADSVTGALRTARAHVAGAHPPGAVGDHGHADPPIRVDPETPFEDALERVARWAALVASVASGARAAHGSARGDGRSDARAPDGDRAPAVPRFDV